MAAISNSVSALAKYVGVSRKTIYEWMDHPAWKFGRKPPFDGEAIKVWRANTFREIDPQDEIVLGDGYSLKRRQMDLQHRAEQTLYLRRRRNILEEKYVERTVHERAMVAIVLEFRRRIQEWIESLPPLFAHQPEPEIHRQFVDAYDRLCADMTQMSVLPLPEEHEVQQLKNATKSAAVSRRYA